MDMIHAKITFEDTFSKSKEVKTATVSKPTFDKMLNDIGKLVPYFDKVAQIRYNYQVVKVEQI